MLSRLARVARASGPGALLLLCVLACGCRKSGGGGGELGFEPNLAGNSGCLFDGPDLAAPTLEVLFGPNGPAGRVDGPLDDPATRITLSPTGGAAADGRAPAVFLACDDPSVRVIDLAARTITTLTDEADFAGFDPRIQRLGGIAVFDEETLVVAELSTHTLLAVDRSSGALTRVAGVPVEDGGFANGPALTGALFDFSEGAGLAVSASGAVLVADSGNHRLRAVSGGQVRTLAGTGFPGFRDGPGSTALLDTPTGVAITCDRDLVFTEGGNRVRQLSEVRAGAQTSFQVLSRAGTGVALSVDGPAAPNGVASTSDPVSPMTLPNGDVVWLDRATGKVRWLISLLNAVATPVEGLGEGGVHGAAIASDDSMVVLDAENRAILRIR